MSRNQKFNVHFYLNKKKSKKENVQLYIRIVIDQKRAEIATTHFIPISVWNQKTRKIKSSFKKATFLNAYIDKVINDINQIFIQEALLGNIVSSVDIKNKYLGIDKKPTQKTILDALDYHNTKMEEKVKIGQTAKKTYTRYVITKKKVVAFMKHQYKIKDKPLSELRLRFATEFEHYLLTQDDLHTNTAHKYIKNLKTVMNMSVGLDWISSNPFKNFRCSYIAPKREVLTQEEDDRIRFKEISIKRLAEVRDVFIFCCYTGFAYADIYEFEYDAIIKGIDGGSWLKTNRKKTGVKESVPLLPVALEIIKKYREHPYCLNKNKLLPVNSNQRYNGYLKEIADITVFKTLDGVKHYIYTVMDNYSRYIHSWRIETVVSAKIRLDTIKEAIKNAYGEKSPDQRIQLITDGGPENVNNTLKEFMQENQSNIHHDIALKDIVQSNSMMEAFYSINFVATSGGAKYRYLYLKPLHNSEELFIQFENLMQEYHFEKPHYALGIFTPSQVLKGADPKQSNKSIYLEAAKKRREINKKKSCGFNC